MLVAEPGFGAGPWPCPGTNMSPGYHLVSTWTGPRPGRRAWCPGGVITTAFWPGNVLLCSTDDCPPPPAPFPHRIVELRPGNINNQFSLSKEALGG